MPTQACADCSRPARRQGTRCERCHKRAWRKANRSKAKAAEKARIFSEEATALRKARATIGMMLKRNQLQRQPCAVCGKSAVPHHPDPAKPREITWLCQSHRTIERERNIATDDRKAQKAEWDSLRQAFSEAWPTLTPEQQEALQQAALADPWVTRIPFPLPPDSPIMYQAMVRAYQETK
jgi:hypothetical protein